MSFDVHRRKTCLFILSGGAHSLARFAFQRDPLRGLLAGDLATDEAGKLHERIVDSLFTLVRRPSVLDVHNLNPDLFVSLRHFKLGARTLKS
jgi:hypothetical protein